MFWSLCFLFPLVYSLNLPPVHHIREPSVPNRAPVVVTISVEIFETVMDFETDTLSVFGSMSMSWLDYRKIYAPAGVYDNKYTLDAGIHTSEYRLVQQNLWMPGMKRQLRSISYRSGQQLSSDRITFLSTGLIYHDMRFILPIQCNQESVNFPYDSYSCYQGITDFESNKTVQYKGNRGLNVLRKMPNAKHNGHLIDSMYSEIHVKHLSTDEAEMELDTQLLDFGFVVSRNSPRLVTTVMMPIIFITLMDLLMFVYAPSLLLRISLLPAMCLHFPDVSFANTLYAWPPLARWFFARFCSSVVCNIWLLYHCIIKKEPEQQLTDFRRVLNHPRTEEEEEDESLWECLTDVFHHLFSTAAIRFIVATGLTMIIYCFLGMNWTMPKKIPLVEPPMYEV